MDKTYATRLGKVEINVHLFNTIFLLTNVRLLRLKYKFITTCVTMLLEKHVWVIKYFVIRENINGSSLQI